MERLILLLGYFLVAAALSLPANHAWRAGLATFFRLPQVKGAGSFSDLRAAPTLLAYWHCAAASFGAAQHDKPQPSDHVEATRKVIAAVVESARRRKPAKSGGPSGDALFARYVAAAAAAARRLPPEERVPAFLLGIGVAIDDSPLMRSAPGFGPFCRKVESDEERKVRVKALGKPTLRDRRDWAQHFVVSAALAEFSGPVAAEGAGVLKEVADSQGKSGFSFADLAADFAGVALARRLKDQPSLLEGWAAEFAWADYMPETTGLAEGGSWEAFERDYGSLTDPRFDAVCQEIRKRIERLPGHAPQAP